nr:hypothetical protein [Achromobacter ruhlandii]
MSITVSIMESEAVAGPVRRTRPANWVGNEADKQGRQTKPASQQTKLKNKAGKQGQQNKGMAPRPASAASGNAMPAG